MAGSRNFVLLDGIADYLSLASARTFAGDFKAGGWFQLSATGSNDTILGQAASAANFIKANSDTTITASFNSTALTFTVPSMGTSAHYAFITTTSGTPVLNLDGTTYAEDTTTTYAGSVTFDVFGQSNGAAFFGGYLWDIEVNDISTLSNETYAINQATANTEFSLQNVAGPDLVVNGGFDTDTAWTKSASGATISGGTLNLTLAVDHFAYQTIMDVGESYNVQLDYDIPSPQTGLYTGANQGTGDTILDMSALTGTGTFSGTIVAVTSAIFIIRDVTGGTATFDNVSLKKIANTLTYNSLPEASREYYLFSCATGIWDSTTTAKQITGGPAGCAKPLVTSLIQPLVKSLTEE